MRKNIRNMLEGKPFTQLGALKELIAESPISHQNFKLSYENNEWMFSTTTPMIIKADSKIVFRMGSWLTFTFNEDRVFDDTPQAIGFDPQEYQLVLSQY